MTAGEGLGPAGSHGVDALVERVGRKLAARTTRRSFLDRVGKVAMLVAAGPALATLLARRAEARVCGQSGVAPKCPTYDCLGDDVWGWCWYASAGCCSNGGLKKICDCCRRDFPFEHGYCPSGHNVYCIVESCGTDPRLMTVPTQRLSGLTMASVTAASSRARFAPRRGGSTLLVNVDEPLFAAIANPLAAVLDVPLLLTGASQVPSATIAELQRLGATEAMFVGGSITDAVADELATYGVSSRRLTATTDTAQLSREVAREVMARSGVRRAWCVAAGGESGMTAAAASAVAAAKRGPLVVGVEVAAELANSGDGTIVTYLVGPGAAERANEVAGGFAVFGPSHEELAYALADVAVGTERLHGLTLHLVPNGRWGLGVAAGPGVVLPHPDGDIGVRARDWAVRNRGAMARALLVGTLGAFGDDGLYQLQAALNGFDAIALQGVAGQGLPVFEQPLSERPVGAARTLGVAPPPSPAYWSNRANPDR